MEDPLHQTSGPHVAWTRSNTAEAMPDVPTPLSWTFWYRALELGARAMYADLGVLPRREVRIPESVDERLIAVFYGRPAANVDAARRVGDAMPGTSGDAIEEQIFGTRRPGVTSKPQWSRYPVVIAKTPWQLLRSARRLRQLRADTEKWWRESTADVAVRGAVVARRHFAEAMRRYERQMRASHIMLSQLAFDRLRRLAAEAGLDGAEATLVSGYGSMEEGRMVADLWEVSRGRLALLDFLAAHGYHGPNEGELSSRSWREEASPVVSLAERYRALRESASPASRQREQASAREATERALLSTVGPVGRARARAWIAASRHYVPLRELTKATYLQILDVARCCARSIGRDLADRAVLAAPDDVFHLTTDELAGAPGRGSIRDHVEFRRLRREHYLTLAIPETWTGMPEPTSSQAPNSDGRAVCGVAVAPGVVEGVVRVVVDPSQAGWLEPGEILVCHTTDPSWASLFPVVGAVVIDIGGPLSHGAIVARELGLPCVINTRIGTRVLRTGDRVRVDGARGTVERLDSASAFPPLSAP